MINPKISNEIMFISNDIQNLVDNREQYTNSDYQGELEAYLLKAYQLGKQEEKTKLETVKNRIIELIHESQDNYIAEELLILLKTF